MAINQYVSDKPDVPDEHDAQIPDRVRVEYVPRDERNECNPESEAPDQDGHGIPAVPRVWPLRATPDQSDAKRKNRDDRSRITQRVRQAMPRYDQRKNQSRDGHELMAPMRHPREHRETQHQREPIRVEARVNQSKNRKQNGLARNRLAEGNDARIGFDSWDQAKRKFTGKANGDAGNICQNRGLCAHGRGPVTLVGARETNSRRVKKQISSRSRRDGRARIAFVLAQNGADFVLTRLLYQPIVVLILRDL